MLCTTYKGRLYIFKTSEYTSYNKEMMYEHMWYIIKNRDQPNVNENALIYINTKYLSVSYNIEGAT